MERSGVASAALAWGVLLLLPFAACAPVLADPLPLNSVPAVPAENRERSGHPNDVGGGWRVSRSTSGPAHTPTRDWRPGPEAVVRPAAGPSVRPPVPPEGYGGHEAPSAAENFRPVPPVEYGGRGEPFAAEHVACDECEYVWSHLPGGLLYRSYLAGDKEPRMGTAVLSETGSDVFQESTLGGRIGLIRYGTAGPHNPQGFQLDVEGGAFLRQNWNRDLDLDAADFRVGVPLTWRQGRWGAKLAYYHLSSHVGDEFLDRNPGFRRRNYVRDSIVVGTTFDIDPDWLVYGEAAYAFNTDGGAEPWELQFGLEYSPIAYNAFRGSPFFAVNGHLFEEFNFGGSVNVLFGWQWRSASNRRLRIGGQYFNGKSMQYSFFDRHEELIGAGIWYDF